MANTRDVLGDQETLDGLVGHTLTEFEEDGVTSTTNGALQRQPQLTSVKFPNLTYISTSVFSYDSGLTVITEDQFPNVRTISSSAFYNCTGLTSVKFPAVTSIQSSAFSGCSNLTRVETGTSRTSFLGQPFTKCSNLKDLIINGTEMSTLNSTTGLAGTAIANYQGAVYVPDDLVDTYRADANWKNYFIFSKDDYPVSEYPDPTAYLNSGTITDTWQEIIANDSDYATKYHIGDTKGVYLGEYGMQLMELVAFDEDIRADGDTTINNGKARMTWISKGSITSYKMNSYDTTTDGWQGSEMRSWLSGIVLPLFPDYLREAMVEVSKISSTYSSGVVKDGQTTTDKIWIPSNHEVGFGNTYETTGAVYTGKFTDNAARKKYRNSTASTWWLRSASDSKNFRQVKSDGSTVSVIANASFGVVPGFCI